jgi:hypothetical protein
MHMRLAHLLVVVMLYVTAAAGDGRLPSVIRHKHNPAFIAWTDESAAFDADGRLREDIAAAHPFLKRNMLVNPNGRCEAFMIEPPMEHFLPDMTLADVATSSLTALSGNVVHVSRGFHNGFPGTLVGFRVTDRLALRSAGTPLQAERGSIRYTFIGAAELLTPDGAICSTTARPVTLPKPGDAILIFAYVPPVDEAELIIPVDASRHLVVERSGSRIFTPANLADDLRTLTISQAMRHVAEVAERPRSEP